MRRGLSPRVRGNLQGRIIISVAARSIPACAGEPSKTAHAAIRPRVYPRVCGGTIPILWDKIVDWGLSPRVRGNHRRMRARTMKAGSIPACAGEPPNDIASQ